MYYLVFGIPTLILAGYICYSIATEEIEESSDGLLFNFKNQIEKFIRKNDTISLKALTKNKEVDITTVGISEVGESFFSDTLVLDKRENEYSENRMLTSFVKTRNKNYKIKVWRSTLESDQLIGGIFTSMMTVLILLTLVYVLINFYISKVLWKPFYMAMQNLKHFHASDKQVPFFRKTEIREFDDLNQSLNEMMKNMITDYSRQKKFTENTSHEIQTPLAVIKSKIDLLIQSQNLREGDAVLIAAIEDACTKLIRINRSLLLLTKIENRQFKSKEIVSFKKKINSALGLFEDHIKNSNISIEKNMQQDFRVNANLDLCLVLVNNLMQNAIRHNIAGGKIIITLNEAVFSISNTGKPMALENTQLYERFNKNVEIHDSIGLGLAIVKEIVEASDLLLNYSYEDKWHTFSLRAK